MNDFVNCILNGTKSFRNTCLLKKKTNKKSFKKQPRNFKIMAAGCAPTCAKYALFCFNAVFFMGACLALGTGIWMVLDTEAIHTLVRVADAIYGYTNGTSNHNLQSELMPGVISQSGSILIAAGSVALIVSFLGCCGALKESQCLLASYGILLGLILGLEVAAGIYVVVARQSFENNARDVMMKTLKEQYMSSSSNAATFAWNRMMAELECCGVSSFQDFQQAVHWKQLTSDMVPIQCCKLKDKKRFIPQDSTCPRLASAWNSNMDKGCFDAMMHVLKTHLTILIIVGLGVGLSQLLGIILTCILCCSLNPDRKRTVF